MTDRTFPPSAIIKTTKGTFHVTITPYTNRNSGRIENYFVSIGSRKNKCIQIDVPLIGSTGKLSWVKKVNNECVMEHKHGESLTKFVVDLAFTIARDINPLCTKYEFDDTSSFDCLLPDNIKANMPMKHFYIAFHGSTWYEYHFGAKLQKDHEKYMRLKLNLYDPFHKPPHFNFLKEDLQEELEDLYKSSRTWHDFFQAIAIKYKNKKCAAVYRWLNDALLTIFDLDLIYDYPKWYIDLEDNEKHTLTPLVPFVSYKDTLRGGTRKKKDIYVGIPKYYINVPEVNKLDFKKFLRF